MSYEKKAVHFGGGNIGRGFVAEFLHNSGYEVIFVDVVDKIIDTLNSQSSYTVTEIGEDGERQFTIDHYRAINSKGNEEPVIKEISEADVVTCAVGPNVMKFIAPVIAKGIDARKLDYPLACIACENMINATSTLAEKINEKLSDDTKSNMDAKVRYANSAIDRIVPNQGTTEFKLDVKIEKFYEWCVESKPFDNGGKQPQIEGVHFVDDLEPYIERKLYTVNTSHATAAYYGYNRGKKLIHEAMEDKSIHDIVRDAVKETANLIVNKHGISTQEQDEYVEKIIKRISNPALEDEVVRVGRAPLRKLGRKERFIGPAAQLAEKGESVDALLGGVEMAFRFQNVEGDDESKELASMMKDMSPEEAAEKICGLDKQHPLFDRVAKVAEKVQKDTK